MTTTINKEVEVNEFYFSQGGTFKSFPRAITVDNDRYTFRDGLQMLVQIGEDFVRFFDMTDGTHNYRLRQEANHWFLVSQRPATD